MAEVLRQLDAEGSLTRATTPVDQPRATQHLEKRLQKGLRIGRKGYEEVYSRIGRQCISLSVLSPEDISLVCTANGLTDSRRVRRIADEAQCDLRRVKRAVWREHQLSKED